MQHANSEGKSDLKQKLSTFGNFATLIKHIQLYVFYTVKDDAIIQRKSQQSDNPLWIKGIKNRESGINSIYKFMVSSTLVHLKNCSPLSHCAFTIFLVYHSHSYIRRYVFHHTWSLHEPQLLPWMDKMMWLPLCFPISLLIILIMSPIVYLLLYIIHISGCSDNTPQLICPFTIIWHCTWPSVQLDVLYL